MPEAKSYFFVFTFVFVLALTKKKKKKNGKKEESERTQSFLFIVRFLVVEKPLNVFSKRNIVKEREKRTQIETYVYVQKEGGTTRDNAKRDIQRGVAQKKRAAGGCSLSPRIVHRLFFSFFFFFAAFFYLSPVPHSPFSELHAPNPTSDPHKGRRGRNTFGKSPSNRLQRTWSVSQISFTHVIRYFH